jgi:preprotein translocase subunit SecA
MARSSRLSLRLGGPGAGVLDRCRAAVGAFNALEPDMRARSDAGLRALTGEFGNRLGAGGDVDAMLPEAFAAVREGQCGRALGLVS